MDQLRRDARTTGLAYLALAITGMLGFLLIRPRLFAAGDPAATLVNLVENAGLARWGVALELGIVLTQALVAVAFYRLFRSVSSTAAGVLAAFGLVNAVAILGSSAMLAGALRVATEPGLVADPAGAAHLLYVLSEAFWAGGNLFFGLWLVPMGYLVVASGWMPRLLGRILVVGGVGYVLSAFVPVLLPGAPDAVALGLSLPATVGEFWMIAYLLVRGARRGSAVVPLEREAVAA